MPSSEASLQATDRFRARLERLRAQITALVLRQWATLPGPDLDAGFRRWLVAAVATVSGGQRQAAVLADLYLAEYLTSELGERVPPQGLDPQSYAGTSAQDGRPLGLLLASSLVAVKLGLAQGRGLDQALGLGAVRASRSTSLEVADAGRGALDDAMANEERVLGWRRVPSPTACGACLAAATGAIQQTETLMKRHPADRCTKEPVIAGVSDRVRRPTGRERFDALSPAGQDGLFRGRGGEAKAELIRSGAVPFEALISENPLATGGSFITESSLEQLRV